MSCERLSLEVMAYADNELRGLAAWRVRRHLAHCPNCQKTLAQHQQLSGVLQSVAPISPRQVTIKPSAVRGAWLGMALATSAVALLTVSLTPKTNTVALQSNEVASQSNVVKEKSNKVASRSNEVTPKTNKVALQSNKVDPPSNEVNEKSNEVVPRTYRKALRRHRRVRHTKPVTELKVAFAPITDNFTVIASEPALPKPVTTVTRETDDEGGTIYIQSTIPAAYVACAQKEDKIL